MTIVAAVEQSVQQHLYSRFNDQTLSKIYIACSGGRDSMALLVACYRLNLPIHVIHINHQLQAPSVGWQAMVTQFCVKHDLACTAIAIDWASQGIDPQRVDEQVARQARYQAITDMVEDDAIIALAHHADDQAETLLLNLFQGTGVDGLSGMQALGLQQEFGKRLWLWRPLLSVSRDSITQFVHEQAIPYVDDPTNFGEKNRRAWLRQSIMPSLKQTFPALLDNLGRSAKNLSDAKQIIDTQSALDLQHCQLDNGWTDTQQRLDISALMQLGQARALAVLRLWLKGEEKFAPSRQLVEQVYALGQQQNLDQQAVLHWQGITIRRYQQTLYRLDKSYQVANTRLADAQFVSQQVLQQFQQLAAVADLIKNHDIQLTVRPVLPNEKLQRLGSPHHEPFKKLCQRQHIPSWERQWAWVLSGHLLTDKTAHWQIALLLPSQSLWLQGAAAVGITHQPCPIVLALV